MQGNTHTRGFTGDQKSGGALGSLWVRALQGQQLPASVNSYMGHLIYGQQLLGAASQGMVSKQALNS